MAVELPKLYLGNRIHGPLFAALGLIGFAVDLVILLHGNDLFGERHEEISRICVGAWIVGPVGSYLRPSFFRRRGIAAG